MIVSFVFVLLFLILAITFLMGKGDKLIAGYNTMSEEERHTVNIKRLRLLMAIICVITAGFCGLLPFIGEDKDKALTATFIFVIITFIFVILANTWGRKK